MKQRLHKIKLFWLRVFDTLGWLLFVFACFCIAALLILVSAIKYIFSGAEK